jgi:hypothetical protein
MADHIVNLTCNSISTSSDGWFKVVWEATIEGRNQVIDASYGPRLEKQFVESLRSLKVPLNSLRDLVGKPNIYGRVYKNRDGMWQVSPENLYEKSYKAPVTSTAAPLTHNPLTSLANRVPAPPAPSNPIDELKAVASQTITAPPATPSPVISAKSLAGYKGADTKTLRVLVDSLESFVDRKDVDSRLDNPQIAADARALHVAILKELSKRS